MITLVHTNTSILTVCISDEHPITGKKLLCWVDYASSFTLKFQRALYHRVLNCYRRIKSALPIHIA